MITIGVIPARFGSTRFIGKPLSKISGKPMIQWVYEGARKSKLLSELFVATDDERIKEAVELFGGKAVMTSPTHQSGTDRVAEVANRIDCECVVNVQGDEPLVEGWMIDKLISAFEDERVDMATLAAPLLDSKNFWSPNVAKIVCTVDDFALYFSRSPIPYFRDISNANPSGRVPTGVLQHVGIYAYRKKFLLQFVKNPPTFLELAEKLEQLRALELGFKIKIIRIDEPLIGVDEESDIKRVENILGRKITDER